MLSSDAVQVLRHQNADAIRAARKAHPESSDNGGYDTIMVPEVGHYLMPPSPRLRLPNQSSWYFRQTALLVDAAIAACMQAFS